MPRRLTRSEVEKRQIMARDWGLKEIEKRYLPTLEELRKRLKNLQTCGFSKEEIIKMARRLPLILGYTAERTNGLLRNLEEYGFSKEEIIKMARRLPSILCCTAERTRNLIEWFDFHQIDIDFTKKPFCLIFSAQTLEARRRELETLGFNYQLNPFPLFYNKNMWEKFLNRAKP